MYPKSAMQYGRGRVTGMRGLLCEGHSAVVAAASCPMGPKGTRAAAGTLVEERAATTAVKVRSCLRTRATKT